MFCNDFIGKMHPCLNIRILDIFRAVFCNGAAAWQIYHKHIESQTGIPAVKLPSTSPANAAWSLPRLQEAWDVILGYLVDVK